MDRIGSSPGMVSRDGVREQRQIAREARVDQAGSLISAQQPSPAEVARYHSVYNVTLDDGTRIRTGLDSLKGISFSDLFRSLEEQRRVHEATQPDARDNSKASDIKQEYKDAFDAATRERTRAIRVARKLGPGTHRLSNGDVVEVTQSKDGRTTVTTRGADGSTKTVSYDENDPTAVHVHKRTSDGREEDLDQNGVRVEWRQRNGFSETTRTYDLDSDGRPRRHVQGAGGDDDEWTVVNRDGSTDTRTLVYVDDEGRPAYEDQHDDGRFEPPIWSEDPPRPMPFPTPAPLPSPFPFPDTRKY
jgi:hypothetical protein